MRRRGFIALLGGSAASLPGAARARQPGLPVMGYLEAGRASEANPSLARFHRFLADAGYVEGQNIAIEYGQTAAHPKDGLLLSGPHQRPKKAKEIRIGIVGTQAGVNHFRSRAAQIKKRVEVPPPGKGRGAQIKK